MATSDLLVTVRERAGVAVLDLVGNIDGSADAALGDGYRRAMDDGATAVVLNFERAGYMNSTGIALIVGLLARARTDRVGVRAFGLTDHYREIFEITRLSDFMTIADNEHRALSGAEGEHDA